MNELITKASTDNWFKIAELSKNISNSTGDISFFVYDYLSQQAVGILTVRARTGDITNGVVDSGNTYIKWLIRTPNTPLDDFAMLYYNQENNIRFEIWVKHKSTYDNYVFFVFGYGSSGFRRINEWVLYKSPTPVNALPVDATRTITSTDFHIANTAGSDYSFFSNKHLYSNAASVEINYATDAEKHKYSILEFFRTASDISYVNYAKLIVMYNNGGIKSVKTISDTDSIISAINFYGSTLSLTTKSYSYLDVQRRDYILNDNH